MEMLIIGIDGGDQRIIDALPMPHTQRLINSGRRVSMNEDVWARGWAEQLTGMPAHQTSGYYRKPACNGTREFIETFNGQNYDLDGIEPLWHLLNKKSKRVGFMNTPTTSPVPQVEGFLWVAQGEEAKRADQQTSKTTTAIRRK